MKIKIHQLSNLADILAFMNELSRNGIHFIENERGEYHFQVNKETCYQYEVSLQTLTQRRNHPSEIEMEKMQWNPFYSWIMKLPSFCCNVQLYRVEKDQVFNEMVYDKKLSKLSNTICEAYLFGIETLIYIIMLFCIPAFLPNFFLYYVCLLFVNMFLYKGLRTIMQKDLKAKVQEVIEKV